MDPTLEPTRRTALRDLHGRTIDGKYRVVRAIAQGGYGVVYEVRRVLLGEEQPERYALKTIRPDLRDRQDTVGRFRDEVLITHKLKTEFVCSVPDAGVLEGGELYYMVMEFAEGGSLEEHLRDVWAENEEAPIERIERWFRQCVLAMCEAERAGVVHRDLKPQNILLSADLDIRVADFGIARHTDPNPQRQDLTGEHHWVGDRVWASPEQMMGDVTHRSDMYSLGATLHYALTRELPMRTRPCQPSLRRKDTPQWMDQAIVRMTQPVPEERFESFEDLLAVLPEPPPEPGSVWWRRVATGSVLLAIAAAVVLWFAWPDPVGDVTWAQFRTQRTTLAQQTAQLDTAAAGIANIASLGQQVRDAVAKVGAVQQVADREARDQRDEDKVPQRLLDDTDELSGRVAALAADIVAAQALAADLQRIAAELPERAVQASSAALQQRRENAKNAAIMDRYPELAGQCEALLATLAAAREARADEVVALRSRFAPGADLEAIAAAAGALADTNDRRGETDLASTARQLARAAERCIEVRDQLPALEFSGATAAAPLVGLRAFANWVEKTGEQRDLVGNETMAQGDRIRAWWKGTLDRLVGDASVLAQQEIGAVGGVMKPTVESLNASVRAESLTPAQMAEYRRVEGQLVELTGIGRGLPGWFVSATGTPEGRGNGDARQAIERLVADLALVPIRRSYRVLITECERAIGALAQWRADDLERTPARDYGTLREELTAAEQAVRTALRDAVEFRDNDEVEDPKLDSSSVAALDRVLAQLGRVDAGYASLASARGQLAKGNPTEALTTCGQAAAAAASCPTLQAEVAALVALCKKQIAEARANDAPRVQENPGIPEPEWAAWDQRLTFPAGLRGDVARGLWYFEARTLEGGTPVPMRLVTREVGGKVEGFLVDIHQVVRAEPGVAAPINKSKQIRDAILAGYYSKGLGGGSWQDAKDRCCFMGVTKASAQGAIDFWRTTYPDSAGAGEFSTLTRAQLELLGGIEGHPIDDAAINPIRDLDAPQEPVEGINTGLREFLIDVDYPSSTTFALYGLRATFNLKPY